MYNKKLKKIVVIIILIVIITLQTAVYAENIDEEFDFSQLTKIMTAIIVLENEKNIDKKVRVSQKAAGTGGSRLGLKKDDEISVKDLLYGLLMCSRKRLSSCTC